MKKRKNSKKSKAGVLDESFEMDEDNQNPGDDDDSSSSSEDKDEDDVAPEVDLGDPEKLSRHSNKVRPNAKKTKTVVKDDTMESQFKLASKLSKARSAIKQEVTFDATKYEKD